MTQKSSVTLQWLILILAHLVALTAAPVPFNYIGAILWVVGAVFLSLKPNERDTEIRQFQLYVFINLSLLIGYWLIGQISIGGSLAASLGVSPEAQDTAGVQLLSTMRFTVLNLSFLSVVAYVVMAVKRLFWDRPGVLFNERAPIASAQSILRRTNAPPSASLRGQAPVDSKNDWGRR
ncbi:MAG: hypothetical protein WAU96_05010 [Anaerolineae bacterium]